MRKQPTPFSSFKLFRIRLTRGSALVGSLVMIGILAMVVGVMLSSSNSAIRQSRDRILYEEAYQAAVSGTHIARAYMINPEIAADWSGSGSIKSDLESIVDKAKDMNDKIITKTESGELGLYDSSLYSLSRYEVEQMPNLGTTEDGRQIVYNFPGSKNDPVASFKNDDGKEQFSYNIFADTPAEGNRNYVESVRITTPNFTANSETSHSLRECTFIIESRGVAEYAGTRKERVVLQRVLIYPNKPTAPLLSAGESIITRGGLDIQGSSHANVHWAPVLSQGNIAMDFLEKLTKNSLTNTWTLATVNGVGGKFNAAGIYTTNQYHNFTNQVVDKWLRWMSGENGQLMTSNNTVPLFQDLAGENVTDFFKQLADGDFNDAPNNLNMLNLTLGARYSEALTSLLSVNGYNGILSQTTTGETAGALVQHDPGVDQRINDFFGQMSYEELKQYAKDHNGYYVYDPGSKKIYDSTGKEMKRGLPDMKDQIPADTTYFDPLADNAMADRILFVDSPNQANDPGDLIPNPAFNGKVDLPDFWKGVMYVNGGIDLSGANSPGMVVRTPDQFKDYREDGSSESFNLKGISMDGIMICNGEALLGANVTIYGTLAAQGGVVLSGVPNIFYNAANGEGRLKDDESQSAEFRVIAGRLTEAAP